MPNQLPEINLLPEVREESRLHLIIFYMFIGLIILSFILIGYLYFSTNSKLTKAEKESVALQDDRDLLQIKVDNLEASETSTNYEDAVAFAEYYQMPTSSLINELNRLLDDNSYLSSYNYSTEAVDLVTHFETLDMAADYTTRLTASDYITDTKLNSLTTFSLKEEEAEDDIVLFDVMPRYEGDFSLLINKDKLKEESTEDE